MKIQLLFPVLLVSFFIWNVRGHGRLLEPPSRSSMWRFSYSDPMLLPYRDVIQPNYNDNELNCGGLQVQIANDGNCGVCGDPYTVSVKENEAGGKYALGIITRNYQQGQLIDVTPEITAEHKGYFEFRLCPWNHVDVPITHECLDQNLLIFESGETKWYLPEDSEAAKGMHHLRVKLPNDVTCEQCVLQWRYRTGNSWGFEDGKEGIGLGQQEEFYGCSDVSIKPAAFHGPGISTTSVPRSNPANTEIHVTSHSTNGETVTSTTEPLTTVVKTEKSTWSSTTATSKETPVQRYPEIDCSKEQLGQPIYRDCNSFYVCAYPQYDPFIFGCPQETVCDPGSGKCVRQENLSIPCDAT